MGLRPETGTSRIFGLVYAGEDIPGLQLAVSQWSVDESNNIQNFQPQQLIDNEATFPGHVIRADSCAGGPPCPIVMVYPTYENFGHISVAGLDYQASYRYTTTFGQWLPAASATQTYHFVESLTPPGADHQCSQRGAGHQHMGASLESDGGTRLAARAVFRVGRRPLCRPLSRLRHDARDR